jgi:hypothetical protein
VLFLLVLQHHPVGGARGSVSVDAQALQVSGSAGTFDAPDDWLTFYELPAVSSDEAVSS